MIGTDFVVSRSVSFELVAGHNNEVTRYRNIFGDDDDSAEEDYIENNAVDPECASGR